MLRNHVLKNLLYTCIIMELLYIYICQFYILTLLLIKKQQIIQNLIYVIHKLTTVYTHRILLSYKTDMKLYSSFEISSYYMLGIRQTMRNISYNNLLPKRKERICSFTFHNKILEKWTISRSNSMKIISFLINLECGMMEFRNTKWLLELTIYLYTNKWSH